MMENGLKEIYGEEVLINEPMNKHTTFQIGGPARYMVTPADEKQLADTIALCSREQMPYYIIGNGSNLLVSDAGYEGVIIRLYQTMNYIEVKDNAIRAGAGALLSKVAGMAYTYGLAGLEFASGIPGTIGGALVMNAGAYGGEMKDIVLEAKVMTAEGNIMTLTGEEMAFGYRQSIASKMHYIILEARLGLTRGKTEEIAATMQKLAAARREKQPLEYPSAGSTFKRPEGYFAGKLIDEAGLRGYQYGSARVSDKHCGFVINTGNATAADVMGLIDKVQQAVQEQTGIKIEPEVKFLGNFS